MKTSKIIHCPKCGKDKKEEEFYFNNNGYKVYSECRQCKNEKDKQRRQDKLYLNQFSPI